MTFIPAATGMVDSNNSTATPLGIGGVFTGTATEILKDAILFINVYTDVASATDGLMIEQSSDGTNWDHDDVFTVPAGGGKNYSINPFARYYRIVYTNGAVGQSSFRLQAIQKEMNAKPSSHRIQDAIVDDDDAELVKAVLSAKIEGDGFVNIQATESENLRVTDAESGLAIAKGDVVGTSFIHKFGEAPDFDSTDGIVTIWDGADDGVLGGGAMVYTYSSTADIGLISSSNAGDTQDIEIQGLDTNGDLVTQTITLTGQTDVDISGVGGTDLKRVFRMINRNSSDLAGVVYLRTNGSTQTAGVPDTANTVRAIINNGNNQTLMAIYTVPAGKTGYMRDWYAATAGGNRSSNYKIRLKARPDGEVFQLKHTSAVAENGTSAYQHDYNEPEVFSAGTDIEMTVATTDTPITGAAVSGGFDIVLVNN